MSLDVTLLWEEQKKQCHHCDSFYITNESLYSSNITHNLWKMADACWIYEALWRPEEIECKQAKDIIPLLTVWLIKLKKYPEKYCKYNAENWWGMYEHFVPFVEEYLEACKKFPDSIINISQ